MSQVLPESSLGKSKAHAYPFRDLKPRWMLSTVRARSQRSNNSARNPLLLRLSIIAFTANGKREIQVWKFSKWEMSRQKQLKTILMDRIGVNLPIFV